MATPRITEFDHVYIGRLIRSVADCLVRRTGLPPEEARDVEQSLWLDLLERWPRYDPDRSSGRTFASRVIRHRASTLVEYYHAATRDSRRGVDSLELLEESACTPGGAGCSPSTLQAYLAATARQNGPSHADLRIDLERAVRTLPPELRELCALRRTMTVTAIADRRRVSRSTIHARFHRIRRRFDELGLRDYLKGSSDTSRASPVCKG